MKIVPKAKHAVIFLISFCLFVSVGYPADMFWTGNGSTFNVNTSGNWSPYYGNNATADVFYILELSESRRIFSPSDETQPLKYF